MADALPISYRLGLPYEATASATGILKRFKARCRHIPEWVCEEEIREMLSGRGGDGEGMVEPRLITDGCDPCKGGFGVYATRDLIPHELRLLYKGVVKTVAEYELMVAENPHREMELLYCVRPLLRGARRTTPSR